MSLAITTVWPFHTPILHDQTHILQYTTTFKPTMTFWATYYFVQAKPHNALIWENTNNNNNIYNVKYTLITNNNLHSVACDKFTQKTDIKMSVSLGTLDYT